MLGIDQEKAEELLGEFNRSEKEKVDLEIMKSTEKVRAGRYCAKSFNNEVLKDISKPIYFFCITRESCLMTTQRHHVASSVLQLRRDFRWNHFIQEESQSHYWKHECQSATVNIK